MHDLKLIYDMGANSVRTSLTQMMNCFFATVLSDYIAAGIAMHINRCIAASREHKKSSEPENSEGNVSNIS